MSYLQTVKYETKKKNLFLRVATGHFVTGNTHSNYYIDVVSQKARMSEARAVAEELCSYYYADTVVDTILCLDGTEVIGACLADCLSGADFVNMNAHKSIYVVSPEIIGGNQFIFRDNIVPMIKGKNGAERFERLLSFASSLTSGGNLTVNDFIFLLVQIQHPKHRILVVPFFHTLYLLVTGAYLLKLLPLIVL